MPSADVLGDAVCGARPGRFPAREAAAEARGGLGGAAQAGGGREARVRSIAGSLQGGLRRDAP